VPAGTQADDIARTFPMHGLEALVIDTGKRPNPKLNALAQHARADYIPLPRANAQDLNTVITDVLKD
ncbi:MAG: magnesium chelatase ATPase subunit D, partial [Pseudomonadota bacterium]